MTSVTYNFQMDSLNISRDFALIVEVKNISGYFDRTFNQLIRIANDKEEGFPDSIFANEAAATGTYCPGWRMKNSKLCLLNIWLS